LPFSIFWAGQLWDADEVYCDFAENVNCGDRPICDLNDQNCHYQTTTTEAPNGFHCPGDGYFADPNNCLKYYHCYGGVIEEHKACPNGKEYLCIPHKY